MLISTMNDLPGYEIEEVLGEVFGLTVRSRNVGSQIGASFKSLVGGELKGMTKMLAEGREHATERLVEEAEAKGANAIVAFRFDTSELGRRGRRSARTAPPSARGPSPASRSGGPRAGGLARAAADVDAVQRLVDALEDVVGELDAGGRRVLLHLLGPRRADDRRGDVRLAQHPGERELRHGEPGLLGDRPQPLDRLEHVVGKNRR